MKLPVFKAVGATFAYLFRHAGLLFASLWLPALLFMAAMIYAMPLYMDAVIKMSPSDGAVTTLSPEFLRATGIMYGASFAFYPMLYVASLRHLVRGDRLKFPFYLNFGGDEIRVIAAYFLLMVVIFVTMIVGVLGVAAIAFSVSIIWKSAGEIIALVPMIALLVAMPWIMMRLSLIFPAAIARRSVGISESWRATKGNSLRLLLFWIIITLAVLPAVGAYFALVFWDQFGALREAFSTAGDPAVVSAEVERRMLEIQREFYDPAREGFWPAMIATYLYMIVVTAYTNVASGMAWRYLTDDVGAVGEASESATA